MAPKSLTGTCGGWRVMVPETDRLERSEYWGKGKGTVTLSSPDNQWGLGYGELGAL